MENEKRGKRRIDERDLYFSLINLAKATKTNEDVRPFKLENKMNVWIMKTVSKIFDLHV